MEFNRANSYHFYLDNDIDRQSYEVVATAASVAELGRSAIDFFDEHCASLESQQILDHFADEQAHPLILADQRFDRDLFRAVTLFGLSIVRDEEIPEMVEAFKTFWVDINGVDPDEYPALFGPHYKNPYNSPYDAMKEFVLGRLNSVIVANIVERELLQESLDPTPFDPLQQEVDGVQWKVHGFPEREDADILTTQLLRDLRGMYPRTVIQELEYLRFNPAMTEADIIPMIEQIQEERAKGVTPDAEELVEGCRHHSNQIRKRFGRDEDSRSREEIKQAALKKISELRSKQARQQTVSAYVLLLDDYVTYTETDPEDGNSPFIEEAFVGCGEDTKIRDLTTEEWDKLFNSDSSILTVGRNQIHR